MIRLKQIREARGKMQKEAANELGIGLSTFSQYETGKREPDYSTLVRIADYFNCSIDYLLGRVDEPNIEIKKVPSEDGTTELDIGVSKGTDLTQDEITALRELLKKNKQGQ